MLCLQNIRPSLSKALEQTKAGPRSSSYFLNLKHLLAENIDLLYLLYININFSLMQKNYSQ